MKKIHATKSNTSVATSHHSFRRFFRKLFASFLKHQGCVDQDQFQIAVLEKLQDIGDSIEIVAREMARQAKHRE